MRQRFESALVVGTAIGLAGCHLMVSSSGSEEDGGTLQSADAHGTCGSFACGAGQLCCNASCGICTPPGLACIQIACDPVTVGQSCADLHCGAAETCADMPAGPQCVAAADNPCQRVDCAEHRSCTLVAGAAVCVDARGGGASSDAGRAPAAPGFDASGPLRDASSPSTDAGSAAAPTDADEPSTDAGSLPPTDTAVPPPEDAEGPPSDGGVVVVPPVGCAATQCPEGTYCDDLGGAAHCIALPSCDTVKCSSGQHCELVAVECIRAPCPPLPMCIDDVPQDDPCADVRCAEGTHCESLVPIVCVTSPCKVKDPICVADDAGGGGTCGARQCGAGTYCCNPSCGICAPKKGACTDVICEPGPYAQTK